MIAKQWLNRYGTDPQYANSAGHLELISGARISKNVQDSLLVYFNGLSLSRTNLGADACHMKGACIFQLGFQQQVYT